MFHFGFNISAFSYLLHSFLPIQDWAEFLLMFLVKRFTLCNFIALSFFNFLLKFIQYTPGGKNYRRCHVNFFKKMVLSVFKSWPVLFDFSYAQSAV
jgi:hypothetical protein